jgi:hypothetical protein
MCCNSNLFYISYFLFLCNLFSQIYYPEIVRSRIVKLIEKKKANIANTNVSIG